jgi:hypothetical protein
LIVSRWISQVSEMMLATVSNVEDIGKSLNDNCFLAAPQPARWRDPRLFGPGFPP